jgi:hypothetical protein
VVLANYHQAIPRSDISSPANSRELLARTEFAAQLSPRICSRNSCSSVLSSPGGRRLLIEQQPFIMRAKRERPLFCAVRMPGASSLPHNHSCRGSPSLFVIFQTILSPSLPPSSRKQTTQKLISSMLIYDYIVSNPSSPPPPPPPVMKWQWQRRSASAAPKAGGKNALFETERASEQRAVYSQKPSRRCSSFT